MEILEKENLAKYTTLKIGGIASKLYFPENIDDLRSIDLSDAKILGAGSNLLINDKKIFETVVSTSKLDRRIEQLENGNIYIGCSIRLQKAIASINKLGLGGIEYLVSIPATIGGAVYMNASVFSPEECGISDNLVCVYVFYEGHLEKWDKDKCLFSRRHSIFHNNKAIILGAEFSFSQQNISISKKKIRDRLIIAKRQDKSGGNCGSVFKVCNIRLMRLFQYFHFGFGGIHFSSKTTNWIINNGRGTYAHVKKTLQIVKILHRLLGRKIKEEVIDWK